MIKDRRAWLAQHAKNHPKSKDFGMIFFFGAKHKGQV